MHAYGEGNIVTGVDQRFMDEFEAEILGRVPEEKIKAQLKMEKSARIMAQAGSINIDTLGQKIAQIPARLYFRMKQDFGRIAPDDEWLDDILKDNPALCAPGYTPGRKSDLRHGVTFVGGKPTGQGPKTI